ncbi:MAG: response regulator, partial [Planctomycetota bacterium]
MENGPVLIVDGDEQHRTETARLLSDRGFPVRAVGSAAEAASLLKGGRFGCAIIDVAIDDMPGL